MICRCITCGDNKVYYFMCMLILDLPIINADSMVEKADAATVYQYLLVQEQ